MLVFVLNCGGSSIKYRLLAMPGEEVLAGGRVERVGGPDAVLTHRAADREIRLALPAGDHAAGIERALSLIDERAQIAAVGHRVVHDGGKYGGPVIVDEAVLADLRACIELAPLHNPPNIAGIEACRRAMPGAVPVAVFDNDLHRDLAPAAYLYGLPYRYYEQYGIRRWGFHGISFAYVTGRAAQLLGVPRDALRIVSLMMGSGTTANAMRFGRSVEVSTGFTPTEGLLQSTRCGDLDPAAVTYIMRKEKLDPAAMDRVLTRESGWYGISGVDGDWRDVAAAAAEGNERARLALDVMVHRTKKYVGAYAAVMGGLDALVFSGGIGENSPAVRAGVCRDLAFLGIRLDEGLNAQAAGDAVISAGPVSVLVVKTDEELYIARETFRAAVEGRGAVEPDGG